MFTFAITCPQCGYESDSFADGVDIYDHTCIALFVRKRDKVFRIRVIEPAELRAHGADLDTGEGLDDAIRSLSTADEEYAELPFGERVSFEARCPNCGHIGLQRRLTGLT